MKYLIYVFIIVLGCGIFSTTLAQLNIKEKPEKVKKEKIGVIFENEKTKEKAKNKIKATKEYYPRGKRNTIEMKIPYEPTIGAKSYYSVTIIVEKP